MTTVKHHHVRNYGAFPGAAGSTNRAAIQKAIDAALASVGNSNTVVFDSGTYALDQAVTIAMTASKTINIIGQGSSGTNATYISVAASQNGFEFTSTAAMSSANARCHFTLRDIAFTTSTGTTAVKIGSSGYYIDSIGKHVISNVATENFSISFDILNTRHLSLQDVAMRGVDVTDSQSIRIRAETGFFTGDFDFINCEFSTKANAGTAAPFLISNTGTGTIAGLKFTDCNIYYGEVAGLYIENTSTGQISDIFINHTQFDFDGTSSNEAAIFINNSSTGILSNVIISSCYFYGWATGIYLPSGPSSKTKNISITNSYFSNCATRVIFMQYVNGFTIASNMFDNCGNGTLVNNWGIYITSSKAGSIVGNVHDAKHTQSASNLAYMVGLDSCNGISIIGNMTHYKSGGGYNAVAGMTVNIDYTDSGNLGYT